MSFLVKQVASLCLLAVGVLGLHTSAGADDSPPLVTFKGAVNVLGVLDNLTVSPARIDIPAGGKVKFLNASGFPLRIRVAGEEASLPNGESRLVMFPGAATSYTAPASATPLDVPIVSGLLASTATVVVGATVSQSNTASSPSQSAAAPRTDPALPSSEASPSWEGVGTEPYFLTSKQESMTEGSSNSVNSRNGSDWRKNTHRDVSAVSERSPLVPVALAELGFSEEWGLVIALATILLIGTGTAGMRMFVAHRELQRL